MKFYKSAKPNTYIFTDDLAVPRDHWASEIHPRDLSSTGILGATYDAGFSDGVEMGADGWQAAREQLVEERDTLAQKLARVNSDVHDKGMTIFALRDKVANVVKERDNAIRASENMAEALEKEKQAHLAAIMQRNSYSKLLVQAEERARHIAGVRDSLAKELESVNGAYGLLNKQLATVSAERAELDQRNFTQSGTIDALTMERNRLQETVEELQKELSQEVIHFRNILDKEQATNVSQEHHNAVVEQLQKRLSQQELYFRNIIDAGRETEKTLHESLNRVAADRDRFQKMLGDEVTKGSKLSARAEGYEQGLNNGKGYAYTEISNLCRELRSKLKGEY